MTCVCVCHKHNCAQTVTVVHVYTVCAQLVDPCWTYLKLGSVIVKLLNVATLHINFIYCHSDYAVMDTLTCHILYYNYCSLLSTNYPMHKIFYTLFPRL